MLSPTFEAWDLARQTFHLAGHTHWLRDFWSWKVPFLCGLMRKRVPTGRYWKVTLTSVTEKQKDRDAQRKVEPCVE